MIIDILILKTFVDDINIDNESTQNDGVCLPKTYSNPNIFDQY